MPADSNDRNTHEERRKHKRRETWFNTSFQLDKTHWCSGFARDISATGMRILTLEPLQPGTLTAIVLENVTENENVLITGKVVWHINRKSRDGANWVAPSMGIEFAHDLPVQASAFVQ